MIRFIALLFVLFTLSLTHSLHSEESLPLQQGPKQPDLSISFEKDLKGEKLNLNEVTKLAVQKNLDILMQRTDKLIRDREIPIAKSVYDTEWKIDATYSHNQQQNPSIVLGSRELTGEVRTSLEKKIPTGTDITVEAWTVRNSTDTSFSSLSRNYQSFAKVSVEQPLLKNFFGYIDRKKIEKVKIDVEKFRFETIDAIEASVFQTRKQYYELIFAYKNREARANALKKAQDFHKITHEKLDMGLTEAPDVYAAEANVRERVLDYLRAQNEYDSASFALKVHLNAPEVLRIIPKAELEFQPKKVNFKKILNEALETRRDLKAIQLEGEEREIDYKIAQNSMLPDLSFEGSYTSTALDRQLASSQGEVFGFNHPQYFAGFHFSTPLERRELKGGREQAFYEVKKNRYKTHLVKLQIKQDVDKSYRDFQLATDRVKQTRKIEMLQRNKLKEEERNFNRGRSESKIIIDYQEDVINAETDAIRALVDYFQTIDQLYRAQHKLLDWAGVTDDQVLDEPEEK